MGTDFGKVESIDPYVRMMRIKRASSLIGKWRDIDNVFTYIASGCGDFVIDGVRYALHTGSAIIIPPYKTHVIISQGDEPLVQYIIHFDFFETVERCGLIHKDVLEEKEICVSKKEQLLDQKVRIVEIPEVERNMIMRNYLCMWQEFKDDKPGRSALLKASCKIILILTLRCMNLTEDLKGETKSWVHIENAIHYINRCASSSGYDNESIARAIGVTPNYLTRVFQQYLGMSLHRYTLNYRLEKAQQCLLSGKMNVTETAEKTGFSSIHVFSKAFRNSIGLSPTEFLDQTVNREQLIEDTIENIEKEIIL